MLSRAVSCHTADGVSYNMELKQVALVCSEHNCVTFVCTAAFPGMDIRCSYSYIESETTPHVQTRARPLDKGWTQIYLTFPLGRQKIYMYMVRETMMKCLCHHSPCACQVGVIQNDTKLFPSQNGKISEINWSGTYSKGKLLHRKTACNGRIPWKYPSSACPFWNEKIKDEHLLFVNCYEKWELAREGCTVILVVLFMVHSTAGYLANSILHQHWIEDSYVKR